MIEFRWLIKEQTFQSWDDRWDEMKTSRLRSTPILQWREEDAVKWQDIPTVVEKV